MSEVKNEGIQKIQYSVQLNDARELIELFKLLLDFSEEEIPIKITNNAITIRYFDSSHVSMIHIEIPSSKFDVLPSSTTPIESIWLLRPDMIKWLTKIKFPKETRLAMNFTAITEDDGTEKLNIAILDEDTSEILSSCGGVGTKHDQNLYALPVLTHEVKITLSGKELYNRIKMLERREVEMRTEINPPYSRLHLLSREDDTALSLSMPVDAEKNFSYVNEVSATYDTRWLQPVLRHLQRYDFITLMYAHDKPLSILAPSKYVVEYFLAPVIRER